jgi:hypothetical protein
VTLADKRGINGLYGKFAQAGSATLDLSPAYRSRLAAYYRSGGNLQLARGHKYKQEHILRRERNRKEAAFALALAALRRIAKGGDRAAVIADVALQHIEVLTGKDERPSLAELSAFPRSALLAQRAVDMSLAALRRIAKGDAHAATVADNALQHISVLTGKDA